jgi:dipeptidyl aminopeptidase/acylaminoacyl peptidase
MDTIKNNLAAWGISNKFGMFGVSAGAHLALMHSYTQNMDGVVKAVCSFAGPTDLRECWITPPGPDTRTYVINYTGIFIPNIFGADYYDWGSPWYMLNAARTPTLLFHGTNDVVVGVTQSRKLRDKLTQLGIVHQYHEYAGLGHDIWPADKITDVLNKFTSFMTAQVQ